jgi:hypothetical protein
MVFQHVKDNGAGDPRPFPSGEIVNELSPEDKAILDGIPSRGEVTFTVHDFLRENYWFEHKKKQYSIPYPKVKDFYLLAKLVEKEDFKNNLIALWILYYTDNRIYEGYDIPTWRLWAGITRIKHWKIKARYLEKMIEDVSILMGFDVKSKPSDYTQYFSDKDMIIAIAAKLNITVWDVLEMRIPAYAAALHNMDTISFVEECMYEDGNQDRTGSYDNDLSSFMAG